MHSCQYVNKEHTARKAGCLQAAVLAASSHHSVGFMSRQGSVREEFPASAVVVLDSFLPRFSKVFGG